MKFEEVLPALREGKKIGRASSKLGMTFTKDEFFRLDSIDLLQADDWEVVREKKKVKLRDLTKEQYKAFVDNKCGNQIVGIGCVDCPFYHISCLYGKDNKCWIDNKDLYSDKFLDQEIEIEE